MAFNQNDLDQEKLKSLSERAGYLQEKMDCSYDTALLMGLLMDIHDRCNEVKEEVRSLYVYEEEDDDTPIDEFLRKDKNV